ncbi:hypothetical protein GF373_16605 [bacterium]|nr:hypothetical protein [bacterium]
MSDEEGHFAFSFFTTANEKNYRENIIAQLLGEVPKNETIPNNVSVSYGGDDAGKPGWVKAEGKIPVKFKLGDTVSGLKIVVEESKPFVIEGTISTNDGRWPVHVSIFAYTDDHKTQAAIDEEGHYRIEFPRPGTANLQAGVGTRSKSDAVFGRKKYQDYCTTFAEVELTEENRVVNHDILLEKAYSLYGRVLDKEQNPLPNLYIQAWSPEHIDPLKEATKSYGIDSKTTAQGYFSVIGLRPNMKHALVVKKGGGFFSKNILTRLGGLLPVEADSDQVILIVIDKPE